MPETGIRYTTAPAAYDGFGTREIDADAGRDHRGQVVRKVAIEAQHLDWQERRYGSGLHGCTDEGDARRYPQIWGLKPAAPPAGTADVDDVAKSAWSGKGFWS